MKYLTRTVWILSLVSLFTDAASEMLYPVMPLYLKSIGFSVFLIGVLEGMAEAVAGLSKGYFGRLSDQNGIRVPFVRWGYALSAVSKPMMAMFVWPVWVFAARTVDRLGKGLRTGARDAMLSDEATRETKGKIFGFHRSMDTLGAVVGPSVALIYLFYMPEDYKNLFFLALIPGLFAVFATFLLKDTDDRRTVTFTNTSFFTSLRYLREGPMMYRRVIYGLLIFTLVNSSDVFLLLKARETGLDDTAVIGVYIFYNLIYALFAFPAGILGDKLGIRLVLSCGLVVYAMVYFGMSMAGSSLAVVVLFFLYGVYGAATEGLSKAWISNITPREETATAIGTYSGLQSICAFLASSLTGAIWMVAGANAAFMTTAFMALGVAIYLFFFTEDPSEK
jgi:MFS family permease